MYCPKFSKPMIGHVTKFIRLQPDKAEQSLNLDCTNYMSGQTLIFGSIPSPDRLYDSVMVNGKKIVIPGGYLPKMFAYLAQKFHFQPAFQFGAPTFYPNNNSWGGTLKEVTFSP